MIAFGFIAALVLTIVVACAIRFVRRKQAIRSLAEVMRLSEPVDLDSFRNLIDPAEETYLRTNLSSREFRVIQRQRMLVAIQYVRSTAHNAALLLQFAQYARGASDPQIAEAARTLADSAVQLRIYSLVAMSIFGARYVLPSLPLRSSSIIESYGRMCDRMAGLTRLQVPTSVAQVEASL